MPWIIRVQPEALQGLSRQLQQTARDLDGLAGRLGNAWRCLEWEARQRSGLEGQVDDVRVRARSLAGQADSMAQYLARKAQAFQSADEQGIEPVRSASQAFVETMRPWLEGPGTRYSVPWNQINSIIRTGEVIKGKVEDYVIPAFAAVAVAGSLRAGTSYAGQVIINLPDWLRGFKGLREIRELAGLNGFLTHCKFTSIPGQFLKFGLPLSIPEIIAKWASDVGEYRGDGTRMASAMMVDAALSLLPVLASFAASQLVTWSTAAIGTLLFPGVGTAAGYALGTAIASILAGSFANIGSRWLIDRSGAREPWIDKVDALLSSTTQSISGWLGARHTAPATR